MPTYIVFMKRIFKGKTIRETIQVDASKKAIAEKKALNWFRVTGATKAQVIKGKTKIAKRKKPEYLRL